MNTGPYTVNFAHYLVNHTRVRMNSNKKMIVYSSAAGYLGAIKNLQLDTYKSYERVVPKQLQQDIWKQYMMKVRTTKWELCRRDKVPLFGSKDSATDKNRLGLFDICLWSGTLANADFLNYFQTMVMNCGR